MKEIFLQLLDYERDLVLDARSKGQFTLRPTTVFLIIIGMLYLTSSIDIVPEYFIHPKLLGYIDDMIVVVTILIYTYKDWGEVIEGEVRLPSIQKFKAGRQVTDDGENRLDEDSDSAVSSGSSGDSDEYGNQPDSGLSAPPSDIPSVDSLIDAFTAEQSGDSGESGSREASGDATDGTEDGDDTGATGLPGGGSKLFSQQ